MTDPNIHHRQEIGPFYRLGHTINTTNLALLIERLCKEYGHGYGGGYISTNSEGFSDGYYAYYLERENAGWLPYIASGLAISNDHVGRVVHVGRDYIDLMVLFPNDMIGSRTRGYAKVYQELPQQDTYFFGEKAGTAIPALVKLRLYYKDIKGVNTANGWYWSNEGYDHHFGKRV